MTGTVDINVVPVSNSINSSLTLTEGITAGVASKGQSIGVALGTLIEIGMYVLLIVAVFGIMFLLFRYFGKLRTAPSKMIK